MEKAILVGVNLPEIKNFESSLEELEFLANTAGVETVFILKQSTKRIRAGTYVGSGKVSELKEAVNQYKPDVVIFNNNLSPAQGRNLEEELDVRVMDRTEIILDIFAQHARTKEGQLQVKLAQLKYYLPRLKRMWTHLSRQSGFGGVGLRGPGETQLETDRRIISRNIVKLNKEIEHIQNIRNVQRSNRTKSNRLLVSLIGYTNSGKSTLLNKLTDSDIYVKDQLFATLDTTLRKLVLPGNKKIILCDTVGFIQDLPHTLINAFRATFEEIRLSDILLHVVDVSDEDIKNKMQSVYDVLEELEIYDIPVITVFNKSDMLTDDDFTNRYIVDCTSESVVISAKYKYNIEQLTDIIISKIESLFIEKEYKIGYDKQDIVNYLYNETDVKKVEYNPDEIYVKTVIHNKLHDYISSMIDK